MLFAEYFINFSNFGNSCAVLLIFIDNLCSLCDNRLLRAVNVHTQGRLSGSHLCWCVVCLVYRKTSSMLYLCFRRRIACDGEYRNWREVDKFNPVPPHMQCIPQETN